MAKTPADFLKLVIGKSVKVRLHTDTEYRGTGLRPASLVLTWQGSSCVWMGT